MVKKSGVLEVPKGKMAAHEFASARAVQEAAGIPDDALVLQKVNEIAKLLWVHEDEGDDVRHARVVRALELYESLEPADGAEGMLAMQMVGTHDAALECLKRAALPNQTFEGRDMALKHAHKLMTLYAQQLATLNKHRGKGQQKVTVEHVNVQAGGQAIVGTVERGSKPNGHQERAPETLEHKEMPVLEEGAEKSKTRARKG